MKPIESPCEQSLASMKPCKGGYFCGTCNKTVHDLSKASTVEIDAFVKANPQPCVIIHNRYQYAQRWIYRIINSIERRLWNVGLRKTALACTVVLLTVSGCHSRRKRQHVVGYFKAEYKQEEKLRQILPSDANTIKP